MERLGLTVYCWGAAAQDRLLVECLAPAVRELRRDGLGGDFWFDRSDVRGPHLFAVLAVPPAGREAAAGRLEERLRDHLERAPSLEALSRETLARRHAQTRGKALCETDRLPGLGENNSFHLFAHPARGYPFHLSEGFPDEDAIWDLLHDLALWNIERLAARPGSPPQGEALLWLAAVARQLRETPEEDEPYWRHHAATLVLGLGERLRQGETEVLAALPAWIGAQNRAVFAPVWELATTGEVPWPPLPSLLRRVWTGLVPAERRRRLLREIIHAALKQLGLPVAVQIPMVLFAWHRSLHRNVEARRGEG